MNVLPMPPPLLAFGFESLPMLGWLAAAAAPWLIHLLSRRKYRETAWAAMDFLLAAVKRRTRRIRIEQWLLLAVRTLVIVALVTAVAEPRALRSAYLAELQKFLHLLKQGCRQQRIDYVLVRTDQSLEVVLSSYLASRR